MKVVLTIFCVLMALFGGGCAIVIGAEVGAWVVLPVLTFVFNAFILVVLWGWKKPWKPAFHILAVADFVLALSLAVPLFLSPVDEVGFWVVIMAFSVAFIAKGLLTLKFAKGVSDGTV